MPSGGGKSLPLAVAKEYHIECPTWSPDGKRIAYAGAKSGNRDIFVMDVDINQVTTDLKLLNQ